jgi:flavin reductase (DIM6/NTAB) family NADH-FMN oxidoreductase RutF
MMDWDLAALGAHQRYKLLVALVVPRPIALVSTRSPAGVDNAAPFSFFNLVGDDPPIVIVSVDRKGSGAVKDTARNILQTREFVVHMVDEPLLARMHRCSEEFPADTSEFDAAGLTRTPSVRIAPPRIAEAPVALECRLHSHIEFERRDLMVGEALWLHVREGIVDPATLRVDGDRYAPVGRLYANLYTRTTDRIALEENAYIKDLQRRGRA